MAVRNFLKTSLRIFLVILFILVDLIIFFSLIIQSKTAGNIIESLTTQIRLNPGYWKYSLSAQGQKEIIIFFSSMVLEFIIGSFFLFMVIKIIKKKNSK